MIVMEDKSNYVVGDEYELDGHCMVAYPDGSVVTASRSIKLVMPGEYRVIYDERDEETVVVTGPAERSPDPAHLMDAALMAPERAALADSPAPVTHHGSSDRPSTKRAANGKEDESDD